MPEIICCGAIGEREATAAELGSIRRILEPMPFKLAADAAAAVAVKSPPTENCRKRRKIDVLRLSCDGSILKESNATFEALEDVGLSVTESNESVKAVEDIILSVKESDALLSNQRLNQSESTEEPVEQAPAQERPKFGLTSICGRRRDMEDAVSVQPWFCSKSPQNQSGPHFFGVFDGHGCSHVSTNSVSI